jgi:N-acetyl-gamma-glutamyl-phosphate reductase
MHNAMQSHLSPSPNSTRRRPVAIVGANGYSGQELARILLTHPGAELVGCFARDKAWRLSDELPEMAAQGVPTLPLEELPARARELDTLFLATPAEASMEIVARVHSAGCHIIDLSGAFRLEQAEFERWYGMAHLSPSLLSQAIYGLMPWSTRTPRAGVQGPRIIANPGCYATSVLMATLPLLQAQMIRPDSLVIDAKSGTSGAGRKAQERLLFTEVEGNVLPYRIGGHQHFPEIVRYAARHADTVIDPIFTTSLLPARRGIMSSIYARLSPQMAALSSPEVYDLISRAFSSAYEGYPLVRVERLGRGDVTDQAVLSLRRVVGTARTHIGYHLSGDKLSLFSSIDNLIKGAAGQAVENFNYIHLHDKNNEGGLNLATGLIQKEGLL